MKLLGLIPVRKNSTRLPGKALKLIEGIPAIVHTYLRSSLTKELDDLYVCTDCNEIADCILKIGGKVIITGEHINGSERCNEASSSLDYSNILVIFGDEVLIDPTHIDIFAQQMKMSQDADRFFLGHTPFTQSGDHSSFKSVLNIRNETLYFSREDIPSPSISQHNNFNKTVFICGFRNSALKQFVEWGECELERHEPNEFLRILYNGEKIKSIKLDNAQISLDTAEDLATIRSAIKQDKYLKEYGKFKKFFSGAKA